MRERRSIIKQLNFDDKNINLFHTTMKKLAEKGKYTTDTLKSKKSKNAKLKI